MAIKSAGPLSFEEINDELGNSSTAELDLETAASNFSGIRDTETTDGYGALAIEMREFYGKSYSAGSGTYGTRNAHTLRFASEDSQYRGWTGNELVHCAENIAAQKQLHNGTPGVSGFTKYIDDYIDNDLTVGDDVYNASTGTSTLDVSTLATANGAASTGRYLLDTTADKVFLIQTTGNVSKVIDRKPATPTISLVSKTDNSITINIVGDTRVARTIRTYRDSTEATLTSGSDFSAGSYLHSNITTQYTYSSLSATTEYTLKARYENANAGALGTGDDSNTLTITTLGGATAFSNPFTDFNIVETDDTSTSQEFESSEKTIDLANAFGDTTISCQQPSDSDAQLVVKGGTSSGNYGSYAESITLGEASTYYLKFKLVESRTSQTSNQLSQEVRLITITNNSVDAVGSSGGSQKPKITIEIGPPREDP